MSVLPEFIGTVHIIFGPYRGNPIGLYLRQEGDTCRIAPNMYPWNRIMGTGETTNKAAADFEAKWKEGGLADEMYTGPHWESGIKPEKPKPPPKPAAPPKSETTAAEPAKPKSPDTSAPGGVPAPPNTPPQSQTTGTTELPPSTEAGSTTPDSPTEQTTNLPSPITDPSTPAGDPPKESSPT